MVAGRHMSADAVFHAHLADCMQHLGYTSCSADLDLWYKEVKQPETGVAYYSYILIYVDDILCIHHDAIFYPETIFGCQSQHILGHQTQAFANE